MIYTVTETNNKHTQIDDTKKDEKVRTLQINGGNNKDEAKQYNKSDINIKVTITDHKNKSFPRKISIFRDSVNKRD